MCFIKYGQDKTFREAKQMRLTPGNLNQINPQNTQRIQPQTNMAHQVSFGNDQTKNYENPVSRRMEIGLEVAKAGILSTLLGAGGAAIAMGLKANKKVALIAGLATAGFSALMTIPGTFYDAKVKSFVRDKEMGVFSRANSVETNLSERIDQKANDPQVALEDTIDNFMKFNVGRKGNATFIASA